MRIAISAVRRLTVKETTPNNPTMARSVPRPPISPSNIDPSWLGRTANAIAVRIGVRLTAVDPSRDNTALRTAGMIVSGAAVGRMRMCVSRCGPPRRNGS